MSKKFTHEEFVEKLRIINNNIQILSVYNGNKNYITVKCLIDGNIWVTKPNWLVKGNGCQKCYDLKRGNKTKKSTNEFIDNSKLVHGDKYDYSKTDYKNNHEKVCIICKEHGKFYQTPNKHITLKQGCPKCSGRNRTTEEFTEKSKLIHNDKYDYSKVEYINERTKVCIICQMHGEFWQNPDKHLQGQGCPTCNESKLEKEVAKLLGIKGIIYERQKHFKWLGRQSLDFYLPEYQIAIECQGRQHFIPIKHFGGDNKFKTTKKRDFIKNKLCCLNNMQIFYILNKFDDIKYNNMEYNNIYNNDNTIFIEDLLNKDCILLEKIDKLNSLLM